MQIELSALMVIAAPVAGVIVWLVRLEGRVNLSDARHADIRDDLKDIKQKLERISRFMGSGTHAQP